MQSDIINASDLDYLGTHGAFRGLVLGQDVFTMTYDLNFVRYTVTVRAYDTIRCNPPFRREQPAPSAGAE